MSSLCLVLNSALRPLQLWTKGAEGSGLQLRGTRNSEVKCSTQWFRNSQLPSIYPDWFSALFKYVLDRSMTALCQFYFRPDSVGNLNISPNERIGPEKVEMKRSKSPSLVKNEFISADESARSGLMVKAFQSWAEDKVDHSASAGLEHSAATNGFLLQTKAINIL